MPNISGVEVRVLSSAPVIIMNIIQEVKKLKLDPSDYIVVGSGLLSALNIRRTSDVDLVVSQAIYEEYKAKGWDEKMWPKGDPTISQDIYEFGTDWGDDKNILTLEDLLSDRLVIEGVNFVSLQRLRYWKLTKGREKDLADVALIDNYLKQHS